MDFLAFLIKNLLSLPVLMFGAGIALFHAYTARLFGQAFQKVLRTIPTETVLKTNVYFLMLSIGVQGGVKLGSAPINSVVCLSFMVALLFGFFSPYIYFMRLRRVRGVSLNLAILMGMYYGSISIVTFIAGLNFLSSLDVFYEGYLVAVAALMEIPAIIMGFFLLKKVTPGHANQWGKILKHIFSHPSILLLLLGFLGALLVGPEQRQLLYVGATAPFPFLVGLFLFEMGIKVARDFPGFHHLPKAFLIFAVGAPFASVLFGTVVGMMIGLSYGGSALLALLFASASYVAVPAVVRAVHPQMDQSIPLSLSLGVTFPFNVVLCVPFALYLNQFLYNLFMIP